MRKLCLGCLLLSAALLPTGCGPGEAPVDMPPAAGPPPAHLGDTIDLSLADLLGKPRAELAALADEHVTHIQLQEKSYREGKLAYALLPDLRLPVVMPVWTEAKFSPEAGFSLPPYLAVGAKDSDLALHLARYGDVEAARKVADPASAAVLRQIDACAYERNYPVEWTRLVGLLLNAAQVKLATGDLNGGTEVVVLHRQLRAVLDPKAAKGPLGAALLPRGRHALADAGKAWAKAKRSELAEDAATAVKNWGEVPEPFAPLAAYDREELARLLGGRVKQHAILAPVANRALDLLALPVPAEGVEAVIALCDDHGKPADVLVMYRPRIGDYYPLPVQLAHMFEDYGLPGRELPKAHGLEGQTYPFGGGSAEFVVVAKANAVGAWVRFTVRGAGSEPARLSRDFDVVNLDRSFEQNRLRLVPEQRGDTVRTARPPALAGVAGGTPVNALPPAEALLEGEAGHDLVARFTVRYTEEGANYVPLHKVALPLWAECGRAELKGTEDEAGGHLALVWADGRTRQTLRLPYAAGQSVEWEAQDVQGPAATAAREAEARALERRERDQRLAAGKPQVRIPRSLEAGWGVRPLRAELGQTREQVLQAVPGGTNVAKREIPNGLWVTFSGEPVRNQTYRAGQLVIRFGADGRVAELRALYQAGPETKGGWPKHLLGSLSKSAGAPQEAPSSWQTAWPDLPQDPAPKMYRWLDDLTLLTYQHDSSGGEVVLRACSQEHAAGVPLSALAYLPRGPEGCLLGDGRDDLLKRWVVTNVVTTADGAVVLAPPKGSPYEVLLVWFDKGRAVRIVARHARSQQGQDRPSQAAAALMEAWGREFRTLGWPQRRDFLSPEVVQGLGWSDDRTRVRLFWEETNDGGLRVFREWKELGAR